MTRSNLILHIYTSVGGTLGAGFMVRELYKFISQGSIPRKPGLKPLTPEDSAFWLFVGVGALGTFIIVSGTYLVISDLLHY
jgi:hypothetical protein